MSETRVPIGYTWYMVEVDDRGHIIELKPIATDSRVSAVKIANRQKYKLNRKPTTKTFLMERIF